MGAIRPLTLILGCPGSDKMTRARCRKPAFERRPRSTAAPRSGQQPCPFARCSRRGAARVRQPRAGPTAGRNRGLRGHERIDAALAAASEIHSFVPEALHQNRRQRIVIARDTAAVAANGAEDHTTTTKRPVTPSKRWRIGFSRRRVAVSRLVKSGSRRTTDGFDATKVTVLFPCRAGMRQRIIAAMIKTACRRVVCDRQ